jgi:hypothetical protein
MKRTEGIRRAGAALLSLTLLTSCVTMLSPVQRQQLETRVYPASYERTFAAARDTLINHGYAIGVSDYDGGVLSAALQILEYNPNLALGLSIIPPIGDIYVGRYGWAIVDLPLMLILLPFFYAPPINYMKAKRTWRDIKATLSFEEVGEEKTRVRITLTGVDWDAEKYPVTIRQMQEEMHRQLFIKEGDKLDDEVQVQ